MAVSKPEIVITYCTQCQWLLRAAWLAQELLSTFSDDLAQVALQPGTGGVFRITCDGVQIWERKADGRAGRIVKDQDRGGFPLGGFFFLLRLYWHL